MTKKENIQMKNSKTKLTPKSNKAKETLLDSSLDTLEALSEVEDEIEELDEPYRPAGIMYVPEETREYFDERGYDVQWVRIHAAGSNGQIDRKNIQMKEAEGFEFILREEVRGLGKKMSGYFDTLEDHRDPTNGLYVVGDVALAKIKKTKLVAKRRYIDNLTTARKRAIISDLRKNSVSPDAKSQEEINFGTTKQKELPRQTKFGQ